jgi:hypothetical protein
MCILILIIFVCFLCCSEPFHLLVPYFSYHNTPYDAYAVSHTIYRITELSSRGVVLLVDMTNLTNRAR